MAAQHGGDCSAPPNAHAVNQYDDAVYLCNNHLMTAINASGYGLIYLTPSQMVDLSGGEAAITFNLSTLRTSVRDWVDIWLTPYDEHLQLPLDNSCRISVGSLGGPSMCAWAASTENPTSPRKSSATPRLRS